MTKKTSWLFLRGLTRGIKYWADFPDYFQKLVPDDQILFAELPGNGEAFRATSPLHIGAYTDFVRSEILGTFKKVQPDQLKVIAISMGAMITIDWMNRFPNEIQQAFLINTSAGNFSQPLERFQIKNVLQTMYKSEFKDQSSKSLELLANNAERVRIFQPIFKDYFETHPVSRANFFRQIFAAGIFSFPAQAPGNISLLASENDRLVKVSCSKKIASKWNLPLGIHPTAGHDLPLDDPQWLSEKILAAVS